MVKQEMLFSDNNYCPVFQLAKWKIHGYQVLLHEKNLAENTIVQSDTTNDRIFKMEIYSLLQAVSKTNLWDNKFLFFHISLSTIIDKRFQTHLEKIRKMFTFSTKRIVFEVSIDDRSKDKETFKRSIDVLRSNGLLIVISGISCELPIADAFQRLIVYQPEFIKLDVQFSEELSLDESKQKHVKNFVELFAGYSEVILTGINNEKDLAIAKYIGVEYAQGSILWETEEI